MALRWARSGRVRPSSVAGPLTSHGRQPVEIWPGTAYPLGATYDGSGVNFALFSRGRRAGRAVPDRRRRRRDARRPARGRRLRLARVPARRAARPALRLPACTARTTRSAGTAATRASCCSTPTPRRSRARSTGDESLFSYRLRGPRDSATPTTACGTARHALGRHQPVLRLGRRPRRRAHEYHETVIYEAHVKGLTMTHPDVPEEIRGTYAGARAPGDHRAPAPTSASPRSS